MIIPFFISHSGCPHQCVFCDQKQITGRSQPATPEEVPSTIDAYLKANPDSTPSQVAFFGGNFTGLPVPLQTAYLEAVQPFIRTGQVTHIRVSTRPDNIDSDILQVLTAHHVEIVELGAQSMDDTVLALSGRGHTSTDIRNAVGLLRRNNFTVGLQLMPGLPGDTCRSFRETTSQAIALKPDLVRIYPAVVISNTPLDRLFRSGRYTPLTIDEAVRWCSEALLGFEQAGIQVIRIGLQTSSALNEPGTVVAGPYHPAFRELVESSLLLDIMRSMLRGMNGSNDSVIFRVHPKDLSAAIGQRRTNIAALCREFGLSSLIIEQGPGTLARRAPTLFSSA